jgi:hypothetical protein
LAAMCSTVPSLAIAQTQIIEGSCKHQDPTINACVDLSWSPPATEGDTIGVQWAVGNLGSVAMRDRVRFLVISPSGIRTLVFGGKELIAPGDSYQTDVIPWTVSEAGVYKFIAIGTALGSAPPGFSKEIFKLVVSPSS